jgi:hypothetical protein
VPHNEKVAVRCRELGKYKLVGDSLLHCRNGMWNGKLPSCIPTTALANYTGKLYIEFKSDGYLAFKLYVNKNRILHLFRYQKCKCAEYIMH